MNAETETVVDGADAAAAKSAAVDTAAAATVAKTAAVDAPARTPHSLQGKVARISGDKTITVLIERKIKHPLYKKYVRRSTKVHAHDEDNQCKAGDTVVIQSCRPLSKTKHWRLVEVVGQAA